MSPLNNEERRFLLGLARASVEAAVRGKALGLPAEIPPRLREKRGAFVSLHKNKHLRGCVGYVEAARPLCQTVQEVAAAAALNDPRFEPVGAEELPELEVELSVLTPCRRAAPEEIEVGVHGVMITGERARGVLLPQVAVEHHWSRERFLEETCRKAGLPIDAWRKGARIETFQAEVFDDTSLAADERSHAASVTPTPPHPQELLPPGRK
ncbi:MAG: AmmeMemoRadiSam system protein A [Acidobacteria bacterium]|nr:AmmeMemoRadiSam system protein A [Acidobacteriota bacterium]